MPPATRRRVLQGAAAAVGAGGAAAFAASQTTSRHAPTAVARIPPAPTAKSIDLGAAKYAAKGDGRDDTDALKAWRDDIIAALDSGASGVHATIPCGIFALARPLALDVLGNNVHLEGAGRTGSVLTQHPKVNVNVLTTRGYGPGETMSGFSITNLSVDANGSEQTQARWCCALRGFNYDIDSVDLLRGGAGGLSSEYVDTGTEKYMEARIRALGCREYLGLPGSTTTPTYGVLWAGPHDSQFSDLILSTLAAGHADTGPSYGFVQAKNASGEYLTNVHVWGRHHYGIWADPKANGIHLANVVSEGGFLANAVISSTSTWAGGQVFGTAGNNGTQAHETGISLGIRSGAPSAPRLSGTTDGFGCSGSIIQAVRAFNFTGPGTCIDFSNSGGGNVLSVVCATAGGDPRAGLYRGAPQATDDVLLTGIEATASLVHRLR